MAKQYKKLRNKVHPKKEESSLPKEKIGKDYLLIGVICFTAIVLLMGWPYFNGMNKAMYSLLLISLGLTYFRRHGNLSDDRKVYVDRASFATIGLAAALFLIIAYQQYFS